MTYFVSFFSVLAHVNDSLTERLAIEERNRRSLARLNQTVPGVKGLDVNLEPDETKPPEVGTGSEASGSDKTLKVGPPKGRRQTPGGEKESDDARTGLAVMEPGEVLKIGPPKGKPRKTSGNVSGGKSGGQVEEGRGKTAVKEVTKDKDDGRSEQKTSNASPEGAIRQNDELTVTPARVTQSPSVATEDPSAASTTGPIPNDSAPRSPGTKSGPNSLVISSSNAATAVSSTESPASSAVASTPNLPVVYTPRSSPPAPNKLPTTKTGDVTSHAPSDVGQIGDMATPSLANVDKPSPRSSPGLNQTPVPNREIVSASEEVGVEETLVPSNADPSLAPDEPVTPRNPFLPALDDPEAQYVTDVVRFLEGVPNEYKGKLPQMKMRELKEDLEDVVNFWAGVERIMGYPEPNVSCQCCNLWVSLFSR